MIDFLSLRDSSFVIAEVGANHQGDLNIAKQYISEFASAGADAIKFQCRNNRYLFSESSFDSVYNSENAFGHTYGEHREFLEFNVDQLNELKNECRSNNVMFVATAFDEPSLEMLAELGVDCLKVSSFDIGNVSFLSKAACAGFPLIVSTGGATTKQIDASVEIITNSTENLALLHCVSEYPTPFDRLGLESILELRQRFPELCVGLSDHFNGTLSGPVGYMLGARVFEKHVTLNRAWKGTDHAFALEPGGFERFQRDIRRIKPMMRCKALEELGAEPVFKKLGKSLVASRDLREGQEITIKDLSGRIFGDSAGIPVRDSSSVLGSRLLRDVKRLDKLLWTDISTEEIE